jgi:hypothetical protein
MWRMTLYLLLEYALIVENTETGDLETAIIESFNPVYDANTNTLTYTIVPENETSMNMPRQLGQSVLVIDVININFNIGY